MNMAGGSIQVGAFVDRASSDVSRAGAHGFIRKPASVPEMRSFVRSTFDKQSPDGVLPPASREAENVSGLDQLTGSSPSMQLVYKLVRKVASLEASVLIRGESGTGKELI